MPAVHARDHIRYKAADVAAFVERGTVAATSRSSSTCVCPKPDTRWSLPVSGSVTVAYARNPFGVAGYATRAARSASMSIDGFMSPAESTSVSVHLGMCSVSFMPRDYTSRTQAYLLVYLSLSFIAENSQKWQSIQQHETESKTLKCSHFRHLPNVFLR